MYMYQLMDVFCDRLKFCSTAALDCRTGQDKGRYCKKELLFLLVLLSQAYPSIEIQAGTFNSLIFYTLALWYPISIVLGKRNFDFFINYVCL